MKKKKKSTFGFDIEMTEKLHGVPGVFRRNHIDRV